MKPVVFTNRIRIEPVDMFLFLIGIALIYGLLSAAKGFSLESTYQPTISLSFWMIPYYAWLSVLRQILAFILSLAFSIGFGYFASHNKVAENLLVPLLDIMQSIPLISFLPVFVLSLISIFPFERVGLEIACILLIFTSQVWNMAFSVYGSMKSIPRDLREAGELFQFNRFFCFYFIEIPHCIIGLVWNSMMSVAGGWFFLMVSEMFVLSGRDFRLPGIGSYLMLAANQGNIPALLAGLGMIILIIVITDQLIWRPLIAWSHRFKTELKEEEADVQESLLLVYIQRSRILLWYQKKLNDWIINRFVPTQKKPVKIRPLPSKQTGLLLKILLYSVLSILAAIGLFSLFKILYNVSWRDWLSIILHDLVTFLRVGVSVILSCLWTVPVGIAIGMNKKISKRLQPLVQIFASVPATALFPVLLMVLLRIRFGLTLASLFLMMLGTQWYILFNVIAGAQSISTDLKEVSALFGFKGWFRFKTLLLPAILPSLVTGLITATGGAWNASIVSESISFNEQVYHLYGIGSFISLSASKGAFEQLTAATLVMVVTVVVMNRFVWKKLYWKSIAFNEDQ
ncbi:ABC transporter permease subunit [bacterium]|nr:ABC transporter permease subunit [bacterium]